MTRKSTSKFKPVKTENSNKFLKSDLPPIEETFDNAKEVFVRTAEVAVVVAGRVDNLINIRKAAYEFWGNMLDDKYISSQRIEYFKNLQAMTVGCYENILEIVKEFELNEFLKEEMKDYFEKIMPKTNNIYTEEDMFKAYLLSGIIKPWGEKMTALHHQILDEKKAREPIELEHKEVDSGD